MSNGTLTIPSLDGIRAGAFLLVFAGHSCGSVLPIPAGFGVTVFFFLSGYLITTLLRIEWERSGSIDLRRFYLRRALRIWPPFYLVLAVSSLLTVSGVLDGSLEAPGMSALCLHYANYWLLGHGTHGMPPGAGVYWSLAVEEHFYLVFPALYVTLVRRRLDGRQQRRALWLLCAVAPAWRCVLWLCLHHSDLYIYGASDARFDSILFGSTLAVYRNPALDLRAQDRPNTSDLAFLAGGLLLLGLTFVFRGGLFRETLRYSLQGLALYPLFVTAIRFPRWLPCRLLNLRPVRFVGKISFSLYLVHAAVLAGLGSHFRPTMSEAAVAGLAVSLALASACWYAVERPCARRRARLAPIAQAA